MKAETGNYYFILEPVSFCCESTVYRYIGITEQIIDYYIFKDVNTGRNYCLTYEEMESILPVPPVLRELIEIGDFS